MPGKSLSKQSPSIFLSFKAKEAVEVIEASDAIMSVEVIEDPGVFRTPWCIQINKLARQASS